MIPEPLNVAISVNQSLHDARAEFELVFLVAALRKHDGHIAHTAKAMGFNRCAFSHKLRQLGIRVERVLRVTVENPPSPFTAEHPPRSSGAAPVAKPSKGNSHA